MLRLCLVPLSLCSFILEFELELILESLIDGGDLLVLPDESILVLANLCLELYRPQLVLLLQLKQHTQFLFVVNDGN
jgi:hypothetical protein